jgi:uncharacterized membrane protein
MWKELIGIIVVAVIGIIVVIPVVNDVSSSVSSDTPGFPAVSVMLKAFPIFIAIAILLMLTGMFSDIGGTDEELNFEEEKEEPEATPEQKRKSAEEILRRRFAMGEISEEDYTSHMARL